jgi:hypothetical protein
MPDAVEADIRQIKYLQRARMRASGIALALRIQPTACLLTAGFNHF